MAPYQIIKRFEPAGKPSVCIIAVQGLWANPNRTWANNGVNWLQDLLPADLPTARVMSFGPVKDPRSGLLKRNRRSVVSLCGTLAFSLGILCFYTTGLKRLFASFAVILSLIAPQIAVLRTAALSLAETPLTELEDEALQLTFCIQQQCQKDQDMTPIILIGHSFGGLVIKQALTMGQETPSTVNFLPSVIGVIFVGTPHQGSQLASFTLPMSRLFQLPGALLSRLSVGSKYLVQLNETFQKFLETSTISLVSFYELKPTKYGFGWLSIPIFTASKSTTSISRGKCMGMNSNHSYMVKYASRDDPNYQQMLQAIRELAQQQLGTSTV